MKGHRNSKGELAEWVIKSHETGKILSSHKSEQKAKEHLQQMHIFNEAAEGEEYCSHCGANVAGIEEYKGRKLCPSCLTQFKWLDEHRDPEDGTYEKYDLVPRETEDDEPDDEEYEAYKLNEFRSLLYRMANGYVKDINKFLQKYDISIELLDRETVESEELFDEDSHDVAMAFDGLRTDLRTTPIGLNEDRIYYYYVEEFNGSYMLFDEFMSDTLWHEAGHAICRRVGDILLLYDNLDVDEEEALVENFGIYMTSKTKNIENDFSRKLLSKFNGALAVLDAEQKGYYDDASLRKMLKFLRPRVNTEEELADILEENANIHKKQSASSIQDKKSDKLLGESTYGTDMDKRIKIFMEGVNQLGLSSRQVEAIGKLTNACMESALDDSTDDGLADSELLVYTPENDAEFFKEAFKRAAIKVQDKFPDRLYEDEVPEKGLVLVDKKSGNRFSLVLRKGPADPIHFDPNCHGIEVRIGSDRKEYPLWLRKSKSIDELIDLMFDCIAQEVRYASDDEELPYNHTGRGKKVHMEGVVGDRDIRPDDEAYGLLLQRLHDIDVPDETIEIATHILGDSKETLIKIGNAVATMINNGDRSFRDNFCFDYDHKTGKVKFCMEGVGRRRVFYREDRATATNPDPNYRIMYRELVEKGFSRDTLSILTIILGATVDTLKKIVQAKHELEERDNMRIPAEAFRDWNGKHDNSDDNEELGSMDFGGDVGPDSAFWDLPIGGFDDYFGGDGDSGEIGKISER